MRTGAVILAAGAGGTIKEAKPMLCVGQKPMIRAIVDTLREVQAAPIVVVTGYGHELIERCLSGCGVNLVRNRQFATTDMFASLQLGVRSLEGRCDRAFIFPADLPLVRVETLRTLMGQTSPLVKPAYLGREGHPLLVDSALFESICQYTGEGGLRGLLNGAGWEAAVAEVDDEGILLDANDYQELEQLEELAARRQGKGKLHVRCELQLAVEDVILDRETMQLLEMLQYTGSLQQASRLMRVPYTRSWRQIKRMEEQLAVPVLQGSAGGAKGGGSQLTEQGKALLEAYRMLCRENTRMAKWLFQEYFPDDFVKNLQKLR